MEAGLSKMVKTERKLKREAESESDIVYIDSEDEDSDIDSEDQESEDDWTPPVKKVKVESKAKKRKSASKSEEKTIKKPKREPQDETDGAVKSKIKIECSDNMEKANKVKPKVTKSSKPTDGPGVSWSAAEVIASKVCVPDWAAQNVVKLLDEGCTLPFIARYRKEQTGDMEVPKLRDVCSLLEDLRTVESKVKSVKATVQSQGKLTQDLDRAFSNAQTLTEVECLYAPFKPGNKGSLAERARALGLEPLALKFVDGSASETDFQKYVNPSEKGLEKADFILEKVKHIIADMIHKDSVVMELVRKLSEDPKISIQSKKAKETKTKDKEPKKKLGVKPESADKFIGYHGKTILVKYIQSHQVLAINRGESNKFLTVKVVLPDYVCREYERCCRHRWVKYYMPAHCKQMLENGIQDAFTRMVEPQICRLVRSQLTKQAEKVSIEVFAQNLKNLLLTAPLKGSTILAIDPGFSNGCKVAVISKTGEILATEIVYLHTNKNVFMHKNVLGNLIRTNGVEVIAIGNGTACRETETFVSRMIQESFPRLKYCIISESGASIYSVSDAAAAEMPDLDPSLRGAVSIGRRLLDPLAEFVKVDPKHLGIGQYQLDMPQSKLKSALDGEIEECVSFVGVDVNTCSECLLGHVAGLSAARAKSIISFRSKFGPFVCREQLKSVKGLGPKSYEQAAGFIRIHKDKNATPKTPVKTEDVDCKPTKVKGRTQKKTVEFEANLLDMTWIHPESYNIAQRVIDRANASLNDLGQPRFIQLVRAYLDKHSLKSIAETLDCGVPTVKLIADALVRPLSYDFRDDFEKPLFRSSVKSMAELNRGDLVTGRVMNVTNFGAFVDIGVGTNALIHVSKMVLQSTNLRKDLKLGEKVEGRIENIEMDRKRIGMKLLRVL